MVKWSNDLKWWILRSWSDIVVMGSELLRSGLKKPSYILRHWRRTLPKTSGWFWARVVMTNASLWHPGMSMLWVGKPNVVGVFHLRWNSCNSEQMNGRVPKNKDPLQVDPHLPNVPNAIFFHVAFRYALVSELWTESQNPNTSEYLLTIKQTDLNFRYLDTLPSNPHWAESAKNFNAGVQGQILPCKAFLNCTNPSRPWNILESRNKEAKPLGSFRHLFFRVKVVIRPDLTWLLRCFPWPPGHMRLPSFPTLAKTIFFSCGRPKSTMKHIVVVPSVIPSNASVLSQKLDPLNQWKGSDLAQSESAMSGFGIDPHMERNFCIFLTFWCGSMFYVSSGTTAMRKKGTVNRSTVAPHPQIRPSRIKFEDIDAPGLLAVADSVWGLNGQKKKLETQSG